MPKSKLPDVNIYLILVRILSILGIGFLSYLVNIHFQGVSSGAVCELGKGFSCESVNTSQYSEVLGIPVAFLGLFYFGFVLFYSFVNSKIYYWRVVFLTTVFALIPSLYLSGLELFVIHNICIFCELSKLTMFVILGISAKVLLDQKKMVKIESVIGVFVVGFVAAFITWYLQTNPTITSLGGQKYDNLAQCMTKNNVFMYASKTCAVCAREKKTLGEAMQYVNWVECNPQGENAQVQRCLDKKIADTPTWIIEKNGQEEKRKVGYMTPQELADFSGCQKALAEDLSSGK